MVSQMMQNEQQMLDRLTNLPALRAKTWEKISTMERALIDGVLAYVVALISSHLYFKDWVFASITAVLITGAVMFIKLHRHYSTSSSAATRDSKIFEQ
jgi:hypothetical protein